MFGIGAGLLRTITAGYCSHEKREDRPHPKPFSLYTCTSAQHLKSVSTPPPLEDQLDVRTRGGVGPGKNARIPQERRWSQYAEKLLTSRNGEESQQWQQRRPVVHYLTCVRARKVFGEMERPPRAHPQCYSPPSPHDPSLPSVSAWHGVIGSRLGPKK